MCKDMLLYKIKTYLLLVYLLNFFHYNRCHFTLKIIIYRTKCISINMLFASAFKLYQICNLHYLWRALYTSFVFIIDLHLLQ